MQKDKVFAGRIFGTFLSQTIKKGNLLFLKTMKPAKVLGLQV